MSETAEEKLAQAKANLEEEARPTLANLLAGEEDRPPLEILAEWMKSAEDIKESGIDLMKESEQVRESAKQLWTILAEDALADAVWAASVEKNLTLELTVTKKQLPDDLMEALQPVFRKDKPDLRIGNGENARLVDISKTGHTFTMGPFWPGQLATWAEKHDIDFYLDSDEVEALQELVAIGAGAHRLLDFHEELWAPEDDGKDGDDDD